MNKFNLLFIAFAAVILSACGKVKGGEFKTGEYDGVYRIYKNENLIFSSAYELDFEKTRYSGEVKVNNKETKGTFSVQKNTIQFNPDVIIQPGDLSFTLIGKYNYSYAKKDKRLFLDKTDGEYKYEYELVRTDD